MSRVVVISGGGTGIGRAVAQTFAADGDDVVIIGRREKVLARAAEEITRSAGRGTVTPVAADLTDPGQVDEARATITGQHPAIDVLVNNAGGNVELSAACKPLPGLAGVAEHWTGNFRANVLTAALLTEALRDRLADEGRVVLFSSIAAYRGSGSGSYAAAKAALHPYAVDLAAALGPRGITVNVVAPGYTEGTEFFGPRLSDERRSALIGQTLTKRPGTVDDVARTVHWLASPAASHVTAQCVQVNGGALPGC
jgi:3-oxoacyl-[acyl-carrier protein] reductase